MCIQGKLHCTVSIMCLLRYFPFCYGQYWGKILNDLPEVTEMVWLTWLWLTACSSKTFFQDIKVMSRPLSLVIEMRPLAIKMDHTQTWKSPIGLLEIFVVRTTNISSSPMGLFQVCVWSIFMARGLISITRLKGLDMTFISWKKVFEEQAVSHSQVNHTISVTSGKSFSILPQYWP